MLLIVMIGFVMFLPHSNAIYANIVIIDVVNTISFMWSFGICGLLFLLISNPLAFIAR